MDNLSRRGSEVRSSRRSRASNGLCAIATPKIKPLNLRVFWLPDRIGTRCAMTPLQIELVAMAGASTASEIQGRTH